jgi:hypothetical protein
VEAGSLSSHSDLITNASKQPVRQAHWWAQNRAYRIWELAQLSGMDGEESTGTPSEPADLLHFFSFFSSRTGLDRAPGQGTGTQVTGYATLQELGS